MTSFSFLDFSKILLVLMIKTISGMNGVAAALKFFIEDATKNLFFVFPSAKRTIIGIEVVRMLLQVVAVVRQYNIPK